jgi:regulator of protease activity HflC (stomatin/prohibitin superfamily)
MPISPPKKINPPIFNKSKGNIQMESNLASKLGLWGVIGAVIIGLVFACTYTVNDRERGVILTNGKVDGVAGPGMHMKAPFFQSVVHISTQQQALRFEKLSAYSNDKQVATIAASVSYHVPQTDITSVYSQYTSLEGLESRLIARQVPTQVEIVFGQYTAEKVINDRGSFGLDVEKAIRNSVKGPVVIDSVQIENIDFTPAYEKSISDLLNQRNDTERQKAVNSATVNKAQADADSKLAIAKAEAQSTKLRGDAEAYAIEAKAKALAQNPNLVELVKAEGWDGKLPTHMIPGSAVPFMNVK